MKNKVGNILLSVISMLTAFVFLEVGARLYKSKFGFHNFLEEHLVLFRSAYPAIFDGELGWRPKKGSHKKNVWNTKVTILHDGVRSNGENENIAKDQTILAVGDSFTFGDQVSDDETWPSRLEAISKARVINGGVFGYGIDQSYLRMRDLASKYKPNIIIFSFYPDDINRCQLSERTSAPKPYFDLSVDGSLVLMAEHIVPPIPSAGSLDIFRGVFGYSFLVNGLMAKAFPEYWLGFHSIKVHSKGAKITCRIFKELKHYSQKEKIRLYILVQHDKSTLENSRDIVDRVRPCIDENILGLVDLRTSLGELKKYDAARFESFFHGHMSKEGNDFVASIVWEAINK